MTDFTVTLTADEAKIVAEALDHYATECKHGADRFAVTAGKRNPTTKKVRKTSEDARSLCARFTH